MDKKELIKNLYIKTKLPMHESEINSLAKKLPQQIAIHIEKILDTYKNGELDEFNFELILLIKEIIYTGENK